ncbi:MAG: hypothetical protein IT445_17425 [Phycisphaeraceae bacterium]|nr:hypothetical protein [Phycisphaeraceae bacterium]
MKRVLTLLLMLAGLAGCQVGLPLGDSTLTVRPHHGDVQSSRFQTACYSYDDHHNLTVVLIEGPADSPRRAATIRVFWQPKTGRTPLDKTATNATIRYIVFPPSDPPMAAVYGGAGFVNPRSDEGDAMFRGDLWQANLRLSDASEDFQDAIGVADISGPIAAQRDDARTRLLLRQLQQQITRRLGYPVMVKR